MSPVNERMRTAVDTALPRPVGYDADWSDVRTRAGVVPARRRRRRLAWAVAIVGIASTVSAAVAATTLFGHGPNPNIEIASGPGWALVAHRQHGWLCVSYGAPGVASSGCDLHPVGGMSVTMISPVGKTAMRIVGVVDSRVVRVDGSARGVHVRAAIHEVASHGERLRVFVLVLPAAAGDATLAARTRDGRLIREVRLP